MRGKAECLTCCRFAHGITPAYAGKRAPHPAGGLERQDHPRVCGEKCRAFLHLTVVVGSPPRMRGKGIQPCNQWVRVGITPAYAGKRAAPSGSSMASWDHPRVCGEKSKYRGICALLPGSPPRMRGKELCPFTTMSAARITPAYAGKSLTIPKLYTRNRDHPRVCGEKEVRHQSRASGIGSPPRMRGKVCCVHSPAPVCGITPAYAGKSIILWFKGFDN